MKRVGTISSSLGFIFLGIWMMVRNVNPYVANQMFNWWPTIFIMLGLEILFYFGRKKDNQKIGFNFLFIFILLIFLFINIYQSRFHEFKIWPKYFGNNGVIIENDAMFDNFFNGEYKPVDINKSFVSKDKNLIVNADNIDLDIKKSKDNKVTIEGTAYVEDNNDDNNKEYNFNIDDGKINLNDEDIKGIKGVIYLPEEYIIKVESDNLKLNCNNENFKNGFYIKSDNGMINIKSDCKNVGIEMDNGSVNLSNKLIDDVNIKLGKGSVRLNTEEKDLKVDLNIDFGKCNFNGQKKFSSDIKKNVGTALGSLTVDLGYGNIDVKNGGK